jgi:4-carboxymuconolactone decarboxylase
VKFKRTFVIVILIILIGLILIIPIRPGGLFGSNVSAVPANVSTTEKLNPTTDRFETGLALINKINAAGYERFRKNLGEIAPDLVRLGVEVPFGNVLSRPGLDLKSRQIATVAALAALGNVENQLKFHIQGALNVGCTRQEIIELITQMSVYAGFPKSINAMVAAKEVFQEQDP